MVPTLSLLVSTKALAKWRKYGRKSAIYSRMLTKCFISQGQGTFLTSDLIPPPWKMSNYSWNTLSLALQSLLCIAERCRLILTLLRLCLLLSGLDPSKKRSNGPFSTTTFHGFTLFPTRPQGSNPTCYSPEVFRPWGGEAVTPADRPDTNGRARTIINDSEFQILPSLVQLGGGFCLSFVSLKINEISKIPAPGKLIWMRAETCFYSHGRYP